MQHPHRDDIENINALYLSVLTLQARATKEYTLPFRPPMLSPPP